MNANSLIEKLKNDEQVKALCEHRPFKANSIESLAVTVAVAFIKEKQNIAVVLPSLFDSQNFIDFISDFVSSEDILYYPYDEVLRVEAISSSKEMLEERLYSLGMTFSKKTKHIFVTHGISLIHEVSPRARFYDNILTISKGQIYPPLELAKRLTELGYVRTSKTEQVFQFAYRGEIMDIFSPSNPNPYRLEYFDNQIEEIREFNASSELSFSQIEKIVIIPGMENILSSEELKLGMTLVQKDLEKENKTSKKDAEELTDKVGLFLGHAEIDGISESEARYLPYFIKKHNSVLDYLSNFYLLFYSPSDIVSMTDSYYMEAVQYFLELKNGHMALPQEMSCFKLEDVLDNYNYHSVIDESSSMDVSDIAYHFTNINNAPKMIDELKAQGNNVTVFLSDAKYKGFADICKEKNKTIGFGEDTLADYQAVIINKDLSRGLMMPFYHLVALSSKEIYGMPEGSSFFLKRFKEAKIISRYQDLIPGDYVVHEEQGIGQFEGIKQIEGLEYLQIKYAGPDEKLYVPIDKYKFIRKYSGKDGLTPRLDHLGGASWARRKAKIRGRVVYMADKLLEIAAQRAGIFGFSFQKDDEYEASFSKAFPYTLTLAQQRAWNEIKGDMMSPHPMDRLLTGDVGFGKTEVAFRAAYKAMLSGKQVALLCPTTVLAKQHFEVANNRFAGFGANIGRLSRSVGHQEQMETIKGLADGKINFVIGTHRLLSSDIKFKDLGLLIVDEEQRFGVTHKEKIKELGPSIDVLTLTATPIPRTLQMSLLNVRSLSLLDDAPINRMPIKTYVVKYDKNLAKEVISRELGRHGQVYYLHNRILTIYKKADELQKMFPDAKIGVVHGQMESEKMSEVMSDFYEGSIDILVCTTIIETGLDVPNCNTIIIEDAQNFGLAQLYQIKGRVGRSSRLAYAYLTYKDYGALSDDSRKRLKALKEFTELGSGYQIATQDLNIRGAGDILGKEQAGFIDSIGYDAYMRLLKEVMKEKSIQDKAAVDQEVGTRFELSFSLDSCIPADYASEADRINLYRELLDISDMDGLDKFKAKVIDIYGHLGEQMDSLFTKKQIEIELSNSIFEDFHEFMDRYEIKMSREYSCIDGIGARLNTALAAFDDKKVSARFFSNSFRLTLDKTADYLYDLYDLVETLKKFAPKQQTIKDSL
jgi:transcription-repair coupling factor (superfamily II helicase)